VFSYSVCLRQKSQNTQKNQLRLRCVDCMAVHRLFGAAADFTALPCEVCLDPPLQFQGMGLLWKQSDAAEPACSQVGAERCCVLLAVYFARSLDTLIAGLCHMPLFANFVLQGAGAHSAQQTNGWQKDHRRYVHQAVPRANHHGA
jgi:hypothetical protein